MSYINAHLTDSDLVLKAAGLIAASAAATPKLSVGAYPVRGDLVIEVTALEIASNDEAYTLVLQGSPDSDFGTAGNIKELCALHLGAKETKLTDSDLDDAIGTFVVPLSPISFGSVAA